MDSLAPSGLMPSHTPRAIEGFREALQTGGVNRAISRSVPTLNVCVLDAYINYFWPYSKILFLNKYSK